jgi:hypothetical protein
MTKPHSPQAQFTPGPWFTYDDGIIRHNGPAGVLGLKLGSPWLEEAWSYDDADAETRANARLIAAAPTMAGYIQRKADEGDAEAAAIMESIHAR